MKFEQPLNNEALKVSQGTLVSPRRDVLHGLLVEIVPRLPPILNAILRLDRYNLGSQAINPIEELPPAPLESQSFRTIGVVADGTGVWCQERELEGDLAINAWGVATESP